MSTGGIMVQAGGIQVRNLSSHDFIIIMKKVWRSVHYNMKWFNTTWCASILFINAIATNVIPI